MSEVFQQVKTALADRYAIERELGRGGMAIVYLAHDLRHNRAVAVKVLRREIAAVLGRERFLREIEIAARLQHPHILPLHDSGEADGYLYFVMPYVKGNSLRDRIASDARLPVGVTLGILRDVVDALRHAHREGVVHRDIKPDNVMISDDHAVVADFGIAKALSEATGRTDVTTAGVALGTPTYMSPEQASAERHIDHRSDIYAVGVMAYEMLAGCLPFTGETAQAVLSAHVMKTPEPLSTHCPDLPANLVTCVMRCLEKSPDARWQDADELLKRLTGLITPTLGTTPVPGVSPHSSSSRPWAKKALLGGLALGTAALVSVWQPWRSSAVPVGDGFAASVAVLPFRTIGTGDDATVISAGLTEEIIGQLAQVPDLKVTSPTSVAALSGASLTLPQIADTLGVDHIVDGTVQRINDRVRVSARLIEARTDAILWSQSFQREIVDLFQIQREIATLVVDTLVSTVVGFRPVSATSRTEETAAYEAYLRGRQFLHTRTREGLDGAMQAFRLAISIDSMFAPAYASLGAVHFLWHTYAYAGELDGYELYASAEALADHAIELDPNLADAYAARGYIRSIDRPDEAESDFRRAVDLAPNSADVHGWYAHLLARTGRDDEALAEAEMAISLDPLAPGRRTGFALDALMAGQYHLAVFESQQALTLEPSLSLPRTLAAYSELLLGSPENCVDWAIDGSPAVLAMCRYSLGQEVEAQRTMDSIQAVVESSGTAQSTDRAAWIPYRDLATYYAWAGDGDRALVWLERAFAISPNGVDYRILNSGVYDGARRDPGFRNELTRLLGEATDRLRRERRAAEIGR